MNRIKSKALGRSPSTPSAPRRQRGIAAKATGPDLDSLVVDYPSRVNIDQRVEVIHRVIHCRFVLL